MWLRVMGVFLRRQEKQEVCEASPDQAEVTGWELSLFIPMKGW